MPDPSLFVAPLHPTDLGALLVASSEVPGESFFRALVREPAPCVARLSRRADWPTEQAAIVATLASDDPAARRAAKASIPAIVPARFRGHRRTKVECLGRQVIGHDLDRVAGETFDAAVDRVKAQLPGRFLAIHTTATERNADGSWRLRVFELLDREATPEEWEQRAKPHLARVGEHDANALDITRLFYCPVQTAGYRWAVVEGPRTRLDSLPIAAPAVPSTPSTPSTPAPPSDARHVARAALAAAWPTTGRHRAQLALAGALRHAGWAREDATEFLCEVCRGAGDEDRPKRVQTIEHTWSSAEVTGWPTLRTILGPVTDQIRAMLDPMAGDRADWAALDAAVRDSRIENAVAQAPQGAVDGPLAGVRWGGWDQPVPPPVYLLEGLIPEGKVVTVFAEGGSVKTWAMISLCVAVARGEPWLGRYPVRKGKTLYLDWEDGPHEFARRVRLLTGGLDVPGLGYLYGGPQIDRVEFWSTLATFVRAEGITLVVADSLNASMPSDADENDAKFSAGLKLAGRFTEVGCTVAFVHHANKAGGIRGSSTIRDQSDVVFRFVPVSETDDTKRMRMECDKPGPQRKPAPVNIELSDAGLSVFDDAPQALGRNAESDADVRAAILLALEAGPVETVAKVRERTGARRERVTRELQALEATGEVVKLPVGYALDDDAKRRARVLACLARDGETFPSAAGLAKAAHVPTSCVEAMERRGEIAGRAQGRLFPVKR